MKIETKLESPFFSIVMPTKNRAELATASAHLLLQSDFDDFELIIVDNDDSESTRKSFQNICDPRLVYIRTGGLSMHENWETGFKECRGRYVCMTEDKIAPHRSALTIVYEQLKKTGHSVLVWVNGVKENVAAFSQLPLREIHFETLQAKTAIKKAEQSLLGWYTHFAPHAINCVFLREMGERIRQNSGMLFAEICPDYYSGAKFLTNIKEYSFTPNQLFAIQAGSPSNGTNVSARNTQGKAFLDSLNIPLETALASVPCKIHLIGNLVLADLARCFHGHDRNFGLQRDAFLTGSYFLQLVHEFIQTPLDAASRESDRIIISSSLRKVSTGNFLIGFFLCHKHLFDLWPNPRNTYWNNALVFYSCWKTLFSMRFGQE